MANTRLRDSMTMASGYSAKSDKLLNFQGAATACSGMTDASPPAADMYRIYISVWRILYFQILYMCINIQNVHKMAQNMAKSTFLFTFSDKKFGGMGILMYFCTRFRIRERIEYDNL